jgi:hypothetical protein
MAYGSLSRDGNVCMQLDESRLQLSEKQGRANSLSGYRRRGPPSSTFEAPAKSGAGGLALPIADGAPLPSCSSQDARSRSYQFPERGVEQRKTSLPAWMVCCNDRVVSMQRHNWEVPYRMAVGWRLVGWLSSVYSDEYLISDLTARVVQLVLRLTRVHCSH